MLKFCAMQRMVCAADRLGYHKRTDLRRWCCGAAASGTKAGRCRTAADLFSPRNDWSPRRRPLRAGAARAEPDCRPGRANAAWLSAVQAAVVPPAIGNLQSALLRRSRRANCRGRAPVCHTPRTASPGQSRMHQFGRARKQNRARQRGSPRRRADSHPAGCALRAHLPA